LGGMLITTISCIHHVYMGWHVVRNFNWRF
jgi:hypothetical protein